MRDLTNPVPGLLGLSMEGSIGTRGRQLDAGGRFLIGVPAAGLHAGIDYSSRLDRADAVLTFWEPLRRGGVLLPGGGLRLEWLPTRGTVLASLWAPLGQQAGRTRPREVAVSPLPAPPVPAPSVSERPELLLALDRLREAAAWVSRLIVVRLPPGPPEDSRRSVQLLATRLNQPKAGVEGTHAAADELEAYHRQLVQAFAVALADPSLSASQAAASVAAAARRVLLDELLIPYDRDLGRLRPPEVLHALEARASAGFEAWSRSSPLVPASRLEGVRSAFAALLAAVREGADSELAAWGDSRLIWLPLQYALRPEDHDTQSEIDQLIARIADQPFLPGHDLDYATDERFSPALIRSILDARDYHVLWIHDFAGRNPQGQPDSVSEAVVLDGYLAALEHAARLYDQRRAMPTFLILLDRYYYRRSVSDRWLELLTDPLAFKFRLPPRFRAVESAAHAAQERLRQAVAGSTALQAGRRMHGERWLRQLMAVQVSVTNPPDPSFRGPALARRGSVSVPDDVMRDHRKIAFADIEEDDPTRGVALLTGLGVGEHYAQFRWLDRTIVLRGPAAITLKSAARELLASQGLRDDQIPLALHARSPGRVVPTPASWTARVAIAMNATGYGRKASTAAKAALYTLMPPGSTIVATDPQWLSRFWGGMLLGSALRGCKVLIVGPGAENAPFDNSFIQRVLQRELFLRLLISRAVLERPLSRAGGRLELGLFRIGLGTYNVAGGVRAVRDGLRRHPFLREVLPFHRGVWDLFEQADSLLPALGVSESDTDTTYHPRFHLKIQFFGTPVAMREAIGRPEWREFFTRRIRERLRESPAGTDITLEALAPLRPYLEARSETVRDRQGLYLSVGSHNQDTRSFMLDGEATCLVAGEAALVSAGDMLLLSTVGVDWLSDPAALDRDLPPAGEIRTQVARALEDVF